MNHFEIRPANRADVPYIIKTWLKCFKSFSSAAKRIRYPLYYRGQHRVIEGILRRQACEAFVACPKEAPEVIFGFLILDRANEEQTGKPTVHFTFVQEKLRRNGIARALLKEAQIDPNHMTFTHWTWLEIENAEKRRVRFDLVDTLRMKYPGMDYDPYLAQVP